MLPIQPSANGTVHHGTVVHNGHDAGRPPRRGTVYPSTAQPGYADTPQYPEAHYAETGYVEAGHVETGYSESMNGYPETVIFPEGLAPVSPPVASQPYVPRPATTPLPPQVVAGVPAHEEPPPAPEPLHYGHYGPDGQGWPSDLPPGYRPMPTTYPPAAEPPQAQSHVPETYQPNGFQPAAEESYQEPSRSYPTGTYGSPSEPRYEPRTPLFDQQPPPDFDWGPSPFPAQRQPSEAQTPADDPLTGPLPEEHDHYESYGFAPRALPSGDSWPGSPQPPSDGDRAVQAFLSRRAAEHPAADTAPPAAEPSPAVPDAVAQPLELPRDGRLSDPSRDERLSDPSRDARLSDPSRDGRLSDPSRDGRLSDPSRDGRLVDPDDEPHYRSGPPGGSSVYGDPSGDVRGDHGDSRSVYGSPSGDTRGDRDNGRSVYGGASADAGPSVYGGPSGDIRNGHDTGRSVYGGPSGDTRSGHDTGPAVYGRPSSGGPAYPAAAANGSSSDSGSGDSRSATPGPTAYGSSVYGGASTGSPWQGDISFPPSDGLPQRVPAEPDVPAVPTAPPADPTQPAVAGDLARIATFLRHDEVGEPHPDERPDGFDVNAVVAAVSGVEGVRDAKLVAKPGGGHTLRLELTDTADPGWVSRAVARLLNEQMGIAAEPDPATPPAPPVPEKRRPQAREISGVPHSAAPSTAAPQATSRQAAAPHPVGPNAAGVPHSTPASPSQPALPSQPAAPSQPTGPNGRVLHSVPAGDDTPQSAPPSPDPHGVASGTGRDRHRRPSGARRPSEGARPASGMPLLGSVTAAPEDQRVQPDTDETGPGLDTMPIERQGKALVRPGTVSSPRVVIDQVEVSTQGLDAVVEVHLLADGAPAVGVASGPAVDGYILRLAAAAAASAVDELLIDDEGGHRARCYVEHAAVVSFGSSDVAVVVLLLMCDGWVEQLTGSAVVAGDPRQSVVRATLAAVNRRLEALLP